MDPLQRLEIALWTSGQMPKATYQPKTDWGLCVGRSAKAHGHFN